MEKPLSGSEYSLRAVALFGAVFCYQGQIEYRKISVTVLVSTATPSLYKVISFKPEEIPGSWAVTTTSISSLEKVPKVRKLITCDEADPVFSGM